MITDIQLLTISNVTSMELIEKWINPINDAMEGAQINTCLRISAFLSQILVESGSFKYVKELWGPTAAQTGYEGRKDLGNTQTGDGFKFRGRGLIQITGRANYEKCGLALGLDLTNHPELLEQPEYAVSSAAWYWTNHNINDIADSGDLIKVTKAVNGGLNGYAERNNFYIIAKQQLFC